MKGGSRSGADRDPLKTDFQFSKQLLTLQTGGGPVSDAYPQLAAYKVPRGFVFTDRLPKSAIGKSLRGQLRSGSDLQAVDDRRGISAISWYESLGWARAMVTVPLTSVSTLRSGGNSPGYFAVRPDGQISNTLKL